MITAALHELSLPPRANCFACSLIGTRAAAGAMARGRFSLAVGETAAHIQVGETCEMTHCGQPQWSPGASSASGAHRQRQLAFCLQGTAGSWMPTPMGPLSPYRLSVACRPWKHLLAAPLRLWAPAGLAAVRVWAHPKLCGPLPRVPGASWVVLGGMPCVAALKRAWAGMHSPPHNSTTREFTTSL